MTIPEPDNETLATDLQALCAQVYNGVRLEPISVRGLIARCYHAECFAAQLRAKLHDSDRIGTHYDGCWDSGPRHYGCAIAEITKLRARAAELEERLRDIEMAAMEVAGE